MIGWSIFGGWLLVNIAIPLLAVGIAASVDKHEGPTSLQGGRLPEVVYDCGDLREFSVVTPDGRRYSCESKPLVDTGHAR